MVVTLEESITIYESARTQYCCFAVNSLLNLYSFVSKLGDYFHCDFSFILPIQFLRDNVKAKFNVLYTQLFASQLYESRQSAVSDKITIAIFDNKTLDYENESYLKVAGNTLDLFSDNIHKYYFAFNSVAPCYRKLDYDNADFLVMIYAKKSLNIYDILNSLVRFTGGNMNCINLEILKEKIPQSFETLCYLFSQFEIRINLNNKRRALHFLHKEIVDDSCNNEVGLPSQIVVLPASLNKYFYLHNENEIY